ncbi:MAG: aminodeoxychorismate/anthranilate synthase component II [Candidatus Micrarchaeia archaeon]
MKVFVIDAFDSFVYMLYQYLGAMGASLKVMRCNAFSLHDIRAYDPDCIVLSPGPGRPEDARFVPVIQEFGPTIPIFGVCLGHQAIGLAFGARVVRAKKIMHGKLGSIQHDGRTIFKGIPNPFPATRYHSLVVEDVRPPLEVSATELSPDERGTVMAMRHRDFPIEGVQFHPESVLTKAGKRIIKNFIDYYVR